MFGSLMTMDCSRIEIFLACVESGVECFKTKRSSTSSKPAKQDLNPLHVE